MCRTGRTATGWSRRAVAHAGRLDVLVNNAALAGRHSKPLLGTEDGDFDAIMAVNLRGPFMLCRAAVRQMLTQPPRGEPAALPAAGSSTSPLSTAWSARRATPRTP